MFRSHGVVAFLVINSMILVTTEAVGTRFLNVLFRSGDRTPLQEELYENDPYKNHDFSRTGFGGLTDCGKLREFALGRFLRDGFEGFLGSYSAGDVMARSTDVDRTKMSLQLVLAGLYPVASNETWLPTVDWQPLLANRQLNAVPEECFPEKLLAAYPTLRWQPIPTTARPASLDVLFMPEQCPRYVAELEEVMKQPGVVRGTETFRPLMEYTSRHTGNPINSTKSLARLYDGLMAEKSMGLALPEWTNEIFPNGALYNAAVTEHHIASRGELLAKLNGGALLKRMIDDMVNASSPLYPKGAKKINLFAGHGKNIAALLKTLGVYEPHVPRYSSAVIIELINDVDDFPYVMVYYYKGIPSEVEVLKIPGCQEYCALEHFLQLMENVMPTNADLSCNVHNETLVANILKDFGDLY